MDTKIKIKEEDPLSDDLASNNDREFFSHYPAKKANSDNMLLDDYCDMTIKMEGKSDKSSQVCSLNHFKSETITYSNNSDIDMKTGIEQQTLVSDFGSQNKKDILPEDPLMKVKKYNSDHEMDDKIEIKEEQWSQTSSVCDGSKGMDFPPVSSRSCMEEVSGDHVNLPLLSDEVSGVDTQFYNEKEHYENENQNSDVIETPTVDQNVHSQPGRCSDVELNIKSLNSKQKTVIPVDKRTHRCSICENTFKFASDLKRHEYIHGGKKPHQCQVCDKSFNRLSNLKMHNLIHEGKKPHQCKTCDKSFNRLSNLKIHNLIHEGKKPHQCKICEKSFTQLSNLKMHNLSHENKQYRCKTCDKNFSQLSGLKRHNLNHEGKSPYKCKTCNKNFPYLSYLITHNLIHEGKRPHQCKICDKSFTELSNLKRHNLIHEGKKPHQCKTCGKGFTRFSDLKTHNLIHEGKKPYECKTCDKSFTQLSNLKRHNLIHEDKEPHRQNL